MRADRLLALLMLLQSRGKLTAAMLAEELEVSERTVYRDMEALSMAGVPVVSERGPGGGCSLLDGYRSSLTGLTASEASALAALAVPAPLEQLGLGVALRQALLKAAASQSTGLPAARLYLDPEPWDNEAQPAVPLLAEVYDAVNAGRRLRVARPGPHGEPLWLEIDPYGLVSKAGRWYLVAGLGEAGKPTAHLVVFRVDHLLAAEAVNSPATVPADFDLKAHWQRASRAMVADQRPYWVRLRLHVSLLAELHRQFPGQRQNLDEARSAQTDDWLIVALPFVSLENARARILPWGGAAVVLSPEPLRQSVADFARQAAAGYERE
jgi:predicted DNA-binding transcriptional regulator YafY